MTRRKAYSVSGRGRFSLAEALRRAALIHAKTGVFVAVELCDE